MKKSIYTIKILRTLPILLMLFFVLSKNKQFTTRLFIIPFIFFIICYILENICYLIEKEKYAKLCHHLYVIIFFLFMFGFLTMWSYSWVKDGTYFPLLFTIPFWLLAFYYVRRYIFGINPKPKDIQKVSRFQPKVFVSVFLVGLVLVIGVVCLVIGIKDSYQSYQVTKNYQTTIGYYQDYEVYQHKKTSTYDLIYTYQVNGKDYQIKTDLGNGTLPDTNSTRTVKYDPSNPSVAVLMGTNRNNAMIYFGAFFVLGGMVFVLAYLYMIGLFDKVEVNVMGIYVGFVLVVVGIGIITFLMGEGFSFMELAKKIGLWLVIPILFIGVGIFQMIKCLFLERK